MSMEGFWTVQFKGVQGFGSAALTMIGGQVFGGNSMFLFTGTYRESGPTMQAKIRINKYAEVPGMASAMGRDQFDMELSGIAVDGGRGIDATGRVPGTSLAMTANITKRGELP